MISDKGQQKPDSNEHHNIDILIHEIVVLIDVTVWMRQWPEIESINKQYSDLQNNNKYPKFPPILQMNLASLVAGHIIKFIWQYNEIKVNKKLF